MSSLNVAPCVLASEKIKREKFALCIISAIQFKKKMMLNYICVLPFQTWSEFHLLQAHMALFLTSFKRD